MPNEKEGQPEKQITEKQVEKQIPVVSELNKETRPSIYGENKPTEYDVEGNVQLKQEPEKKGKGYGIKEGFGAIGYTFAKGIPLIAKAGVGAAKYGITKTGKFLKSREFQEGTRESRSEREFFYKYAPKSGGRTSGGGITRNYGNAPSDVYFGASYRPNMTNLAIGKLSRLNPDERAFSFNETATVLADRNERPKLTAEEMNRVFNFADAGKQSFFSQVRLQRENVHALAKSYPVTPKSSAYKLGSAFNFKNNGKGMFSQFKAPREQMMGFKNFSAKRGK